MLKKVFIALITVVVCVAIGATVLGVFLPNVTNQLVGNVEIAIHSATGANFDINGDGVIGKPTVKTDTGTNNAGSGVGVDGFDGMSK